MLGPKVKALRRRTDLLTTSTTDQSAMTSRLGQNLVIQRRLRDLAELRAGTSPAGPIGICLQNGQGGHSD